MRSLVVIFMIFFTTSASAKDLYLKCVHDESVEEKTYFQINVDEQSFSSAADPQGNWTNFPSVEISPSRIIARLYIGSTELMYIVDRKDLTYSWHQKMFTGRLPTESGKCELTDLEIKTAI